MDEIDLTDYSDELHMVSAQLREALPAKLRDECDEVEIGQKDNEEALIRFSFIHLPAPVGVEVPTEHLVPPVHPGHIMGWAQMAAQKCAQYDRYGSHNN